MSPITAFGFGLLIAYVVYVVVDFTMTPAGEASHPSRDFMGAPLKGAYTKQLTIGGILMFTFALMRGFSS